MIYLLYQQDRILFRIRQKKLACSAFFYTSFACGDKKKRMHSTAYSFHETLKNLACSAFVFTFCFGAFENFGAFDFSVVFGLPVHCY
jgi:hypothetical protein